MLCDHLIPQGIGMHTVGEPVLMILRQFMQIDDLEVQILRLSPDNRRNAAVYCFCADIEADLSGFGIGIALRRGHHDDARMILQIPVFFAEGMEFPLISFLIPVVGLCIIAAEHDQIDFGRAVS